MADTDKLIKAILGVLLPPVMVYMEKRQCNAEFWISLILWLLIFLWPVSIIYSFHVCGYSDILMNVLSCLLPPVAAFLKFKCNMEFFVSLILWFFFFVPSVIYTYFVTMWINNYLTNFTYQKMSSFGDLYIFQNKKLFSRDFRPLLWEWVGWWLPALALFWSSYLCPCRWWSWWPSRDARTFLTSRLDAGKSRRKKESRSW